LPDCMLYGLAEGEDEFMAALVHVDLVVRDLKRSMKFYVDLFGCTVVEDAVLTGAVVDFYSRGKAASMRIVLLKVMPSMLMMGMMIELMEFTPKVASEPVVIRDASEAPLPSILNLTFLVDDIAAVLEKSGAKPISPVIEISLPKSGDARLVFIRDPDGNLIELAERRRPAEADG
jgi:catechol 2,3-dioxygenase-like lactoylglutathione lyase family enzyme